MIRDLTVGELITQLSEYPADTPIRVRQGPYFPSTAKSVRYTQHATVDGPYVVIDESASELVSVDRNKNGKGVYIDLFETEKERNERCARQRAQEEIVREVAKSLPHAFK